ncbi:hypothetical protein ILUMI_02086 [Ignelater luminosus]|uniref:Serpin domain-containing protein n=1 Tax=Ignelater luminosus TaxID=2038154 RepID=A0A8K0DH31_IGNLU|nr:hypothetical protein ILUMI_02086 [Ignelater luminosus]
MKITFGVCTLIFSVLLGSSHQQCLTANDKRLPGRTGHETLYSGQQAFSLALLQAVNQLTPDENLFFSPYSTYQALLLAYFISANQTEAYLRKMLRLNPDQDKSDIFGAYKFDKFTTSFRVTNTTYEFTSANRIYVTDQIPLRDCVVDLFGEELIKANFLSNPETLRNEINHWVEQHTHDMIKDLLPPGTIQHDTNLVLVNAAYFKGKWENKFDPKKTKPEVFYISPSKQTIVDMMHIEATFNYDVSETLMAHVLELPYEGEDISMYILLPPFSKEDGIETVLKKLTLENFRSVVNGSLSPRQVQVSFPKFGLEHTIELVPILERLGVGNLFRQDADFTVLSNERALSLGEGIHKAKIVVSEEGTKAAAATVLVTWRIMDEESESPVQFKCDRPFIFVIFNKPMNTVLFTGILRSPE